MPSSFVPALLVRAWAVDGPGRRRGIRGVLDVLAFGLGIAAVVGVAGTIVVARGAGRAAYEDIVLQARALATDTLPEPNAPSPAIRWLTGNADPRGNLPWPFGSTDYLVWWGTGSWPLWLASVPALVYLASVPAATRGDGWPPAGRWPPGFRSALPGLYWQHYYLLPIPGVAIVVAVALGDAIVGLARSLGFAKVDPTGQDGRAAAIAVPTPVPGRRRDRRPDRRDRLDDGPPGPVLPGRPAEELTIRYKGGRQWVVLRDLGRDVARRAAIWDDPHAVRLGLAEPAVFLREAGQPHAPLLRGQPAARPGGSRSSADRPARRGDHGHAPRPGRRS